MLSLAVYRLAKVGALKTQPSQNIYFTKTE